MRPQQVAHDAADGTGDAHREDHQPVHQVGDQAGVVAGKVEHLGVAACRAQVKTHQGGKGNDGKGPGAGAEDAIVQADAQTDGQSQHGFFGRQGAVVAVLVRQVPPPQDEHGRDGQDDEHHGPQRLIAEQQHDVGAKGAAHKAARCRQQAHFDVHGTLLEKLRRGKGGAAGGAEFVGAVGVVGREPRKQVGRQADESAAARCRVHKARKAGHAHQEDQHQRRDRYTFCHVSLYFSRCCIFFRFFTAVSSGRSRRAPRMDQSRYSLPSQARIWSRIIRETRAP